MGLDQNGSHGQEWGLAQQRAIVKALLGYLAVMWKSSSDECPGVLICNHYSSLVPRGCASCLFSLMTNKGISSMVSGTSPSHCSAGVTPVDASDFA